MRLGGLLQFRRVIALVAILVSAWVGVFGVLSWHADRDGIGGLASLVILGGSGLFGLVIAISLFFGGSSRREFNESGYLSEGARVPLIVTCLLAFGAMLVYIGARGIVQGHMPDLGEHPDAVFTTAPVRFVLLFGFWCGLGLLCGWGALRAARHQRAAEFTEEHDDAGSR